MLYPESRFAHCNSILGKNLELVQISLLMRHHVNKTSAYTWADSVFHLSLVSFTTFFCYSVGCVYAKFREPRRHCFSFHVLCCKAKSYLQEELTPEIIKMRIRQWLLKKLAKWMQQNRSIGWPSACETIKHIRVKKNHFNSMHL